MTRPIKFRAWCVPSKSFVSDSAVKSNFFNYLNMTDEYVIQQFTGLLDKNGKEIFEGDILGYWGSAAWEVLWVEKKSAFRFGNWVSNFPMTECTKKEIIGNIYENSELLK